MNILTTTHVSAYRDHLYAEERAPATVDAYVRDVELFTAWLGKRAVTKEAVMGWKGYLLASGRSSSTVNRKLTALNGLLVLLGWEDCRVRHLKLQRRAFRDAARNLSREEYLRLLETARDQGKARLALLLETICATGIRVSEVRYITLEAAKRGRADVALKGKIRTVMLPDKLCRKLLKYARTEKIAFGELFLSEDGTPISRNQIWRQMKTLCEEADVAPAKVFPHNLRHLFAVAFYQVTRDVVKLADVLGHSSINTTRIYLLTTGTEHLRHLNSLGLIS